MITNEFKSAVKNGDLLMVRIMLKDSFTTDHSLCQFKEMFQYANKKLSSLLVPYDQEPLEYDVHKWDENTLNIELVRLVNNFSIERINHLQRVIDKIYGLQISQKKKIDYHSPSYNSHSDMEKNKSQSQRKKDAIRQMMNEAGNICSIYQKIKSKDTFNLKDVDGMEQSAEALIKAISLYKKDRRLI